MNTIVLNFASSAGWMPRPPIENQRRALFTAGAKSTATRARQTTPKHDQMKTGSRYQR